MKAWDSTGNTDSCSSQILVYQQHRHDLALGWACHLIAASTAANFVEYFVRLFHSLRCGVLNQAMRIPSNQNRECWNQLSIIVPSTIITYTWARNLSVRFPTVPSLHRLFIPLFQEIGSQSFQMADCQIVRSVWVSLVSSFPINMWRSNELHVTLL